MRTSLSIPIPIPNSYPLWGRSVGFVPILPQPIVRTKSFSSSSSNLGHLRSRISSQLSVAAAGFDAQRVYPDPFYTQPVVPPVAGFDAADPPMLPVVVPIADAQAQVLAIDSIDPQPVVPVVLPITRIDAFPGAHSWPENPLIKHNKLILQPHLLFLKKISTTDQNLWENHTTNLYHHPFCFVGHGSYHFAGCCNNLLLVCFYDDLDRDGMCVAPREALWDLTTNDLKFLPQIQAPRFVFSHSRVKYTTISSYGFGFDFFTDDYKVIRFAQLVFEDGSRSLGSEYVELYSLKNDSWKRITNSDPGNVNHFQVPSVYVNGIFYWKANIEEETSFSAPELVLSYDFSCGTFSHVPDPMLQRKESLFDDYDLVEWDGLPAALFHSELPGGIRRRSGSPLPFTFEIWVWSGIDSSWACRVPVTQVPATNVATIVGLFENDKLFLQSTESELLLFDCATGVLENLGIHADPRRLFVPPKNKYG